VSVSKRSWASHLNSKGHQDAVAQCESIDNHALELERQSHQVYHGAAAELQSASLGPRPPRPQMQALALYPDLHEAHFELDQDILAQSISAEPVQDDAAATEAANKKLMEQEFMALLMQSYEEEFSNGDDRDDTIPATTQLFQALRVYPFRYLSIRYSESYLQILMTMKNQKSIRVVFQMKVGPHTIQRRYEKYPS
jgi:hypothetical protein